MQKGNKKNKFPSEFFFYNTMKFIGGFDTL